MDRYWFLTWTTCGSWLPGDRRGSVTRVRSDAGARSASNVPGTPHDRPMPELATASEGLQHAGSVRLRREHAVVVLEQLRETASIRGWTLFAVAVMANHVHVVVGVDGDPEPSTLLRDFKGWASRALNARWPRNGGRWWTSKGSMRRLERAAAVLAAREYVRQQEYPLVVWVPDWDVVVGE